MAWLVFIDDLHLDFRNTGHLRDLVRLVGRELIKDGDTFTLRSAGPSQVEIDWTTDLTWLQSGAKQVFGNGLKPSDIIASLDDAGQIELRYRAGTALAVVSELMSAARAVPSRRKALVYISNGYDLDDVTFRAWLGAVARRARDLDVRIFAIGTLRNTIARDPGLDDQAWQKHLSTTQDTLRRLSDETGGFAVLDVQDPAAAFKKIAAFRR